MSRDEASLAEFPLNRNTARHSALFPGIACAAFLAILGFGLQFRLNGPPTEATNVTSEGTSSHTVRSTVSVPRRRIFPFSVVPGGVYSAKQAGESAADLLVASHYRDLKLSKLQPTVLDHPIQRYISFRQNGTIYWTTKKLTVPAGEFLLVQRGEPRSDLVRARCGNRLSETARAPVLPPALRSPGGRNLKHR